jgi:hypothetical protein
MCPSNQHEFCTISDDATAGIPLAIHMEFLPTTGQEYSAASIVIDQPAPRAVGDQIFYREFLFPGVHHQGLP